MYTAQQVANYVIDYGLHNNIPVSNLKLQKLLYFIWIDYYKENERKLFADKFCAWKFGPVIPKVYYEYCAFGGFPIFAQSYPSNDIAQRDRTIINETKKKNKNASVGYLVELTHDPGKPWDKTYLGGIGEHDVIPFEDIIELECKVNAES